MKIDSKYRRHDRADIHDLQPASERARRQSGDQIRARGSVCGAMHGAGASCEAGRQAYLARAVRTHQWRALRRLARRAAPSGWLWRLRSRRRPASAPQHLNAFEPRDRTCTVTQTKGVVHGYPRSLVRYEQAHGRYTIVITCNPGSGDMCNYMPPAALPPPP